MSFGIAVATTEGLMDLSGIRSLQRVASVAVTATSGSMSFPAGLTASDSFPRILVNDGKTPPNLSIADNTTVGWNDRGNSNPSSDFNVEFYRFG